MNRDVTSEPIVKPSPRMQARIVGAYYLLRLFSASFGTAKAVPFPNLFRRNKNRIRKRSLLAQHQLGDRGQLHV